MLTPKQSTSAMLLALNHTQTEVAERARVSLGSIQRWLKQPDFQALVESYRTQMFERIAGHTAEEVMADLPNTFARLKTLRGETKNLNVALGACRELFARQMPARTHHEEDRTIRIILEKREEQHARTVLEEDRIMDVEDAQVIDVSQS